jgi:hypothetical protein
MKTLSIHVGPAEISPHSRPGAPLLKLALVRALLLGLLLPLFATPAQARCRGCHLRYDRQPIQTEGAA